MEPNDEAQVRALLESDPDFFMMSAETRLRLAE
jgi:hypothetical protein